LDLIFNWESKWKGVSWNFKIQRDSFAFHRNLSLTRRSKWWNSGNSSQWLEGCSEVFVSSWFSYELTKSIRTCFLKIKKSSWWSLTETTWRRNFRRKFVEHSAHCFLESFGANSTLYSRGNSRSISPSRCPPPGSLEFRNCCQSWTCSTRETWDFVFVASRAARRRKLKELRYRKQLAFHFKFKMIAAQRLNTLNTTKNWTRSWWTTGGAEVSLKWSFFFRSWTLYYRREGIELKLRVRGRFHSSSPEHRSVQPIESINVPRDRCSPGDPLPPLMTPNMQIHWSGSGQNQWRTNTQFDHLKMLSISIHSKLNCN